MERILTALLATTALLSGCATTPPKASSGSCPMCSKPVADGPEVRVILAGENGPGRRYRCFLCPIMEGKSGRKWTMRAVSGLDGRWVTFRIDDGRVVSAPSTAVVLAQPVGPGDECLDVHRVFVDEAEFRRYMEAHPELGRGTPQTLGDVLKANAR